VSAAWLVCDLVGNGDNLLIIIKASRLTGDIDAPRLSISVDLCEQADSLIEARSEDRGDLDCLHALSNRHRMPQLPIEICGNIDHLHVRMAPGCLGW
jgi:hypothetical protein